MDDFSTLREMNYSGRGIVVGMTLEGHPFMGYTLTGRSGSSQARKLVYDPTEELVKTDVTNSEELKKGNPSLLLYPAMAHIDSMLCASNGAHTELIVERMELEGSPSLTDAFSSYAMQDGIDLTSYEPDQPNYTPRISGLSYNPIGEIYMVKRDKQGNCHRLWEQFNLFPGRGKLITTYRGGNETPLAPFEGNALEVEINSLTSQDICEGLYEAIGLKNGVNYRVASAVMMTLPTELSVAIINRVDRGN